MERQRACSKEGRARGVFKERAGDFCWRHRDQPTFLAWQLGLAFQARLWSFLVTMLTVGWVAGPRRMSLWVAAGELVVEFKFFAEAGLGMETSSKQADGVGFRCRDGSSGCPIELRPISPEATCFGRRASGRGFHVGPGLGGEFCCSEPENGAGPGVVSEPFWAPASDGPWRYAGEPAETEWKHGESEAVARPAQRDGPSCVDFTDGLG